MSKVEHPKSLIIVAVIVALITAIRFTSTLWHQPIGRVDPHINLIEERTREIAGKQQQQQIAAFVAVTQGEVFRTEQRIREATALATAVSLFAANEILNRRIPASVTAVFVGANNAGLIPPGLQLVAADGTVISDRGKLLVRYRTEPLGIEVLSLGRDAIDGPALLVRLQGDQFSGTEKKNATLYIATTLDQTTLPSPFASEAEIFALGFLSESLRAAEPPKR